LLTAEQGADTLIWLATAAAPGETTGQYFHNRTAVPPSAAANDVEAAERLWQESEKLALEADSHPPVSLDRGHDP
jgi:hypothetical protein